MKTRDQNLAHLAIVARGLGELAAEVAFVGGATIAAYIDDASAADARVTKDVDCVIELVGYTAFADLERRLRTLGFANSLDPRAPICRWTYRGLEVDVMPTDPTILGFSNRWYGEAMLHRQSVSLASDLSIWVFPIPYLIATKLEAFKQRGQGDWLASHDLEDIIALLDGASACEATLQSTTGELRSYVVRELRKLYNHPDATEILAAHLPSDPGSKGRVMRIKQVLAKLVDGQQK